jgi:hypothetical protein
LNSPALQAAAGILATTAYAASSSLREAHELVEAIAGEASEQIDKMYEVQKASKKEA